MTYEEITKKFEARKTKHLLYSIGLDVAGMGTYLIPILGEFGDTIYAPFYGIAIFSIYKMRLGSAAIGGMTGFVEELLPGTDIIPTATAMWAYTYVARRESTLKKFIKREQGDRVMMQRAAAGLSPTPNLWTRITNVFTGGNQQSYTRYEETDASLFDDGGRDIPKLR